MATSDRLVTNFINFGANLATHGTRTNSVEAWNKPAKVYGAVIKLAGGRLFRKTTAYAISHTRIIVGSPQKTRASLISNGTPYGVDSSAGGYRSDLIFSNMTLPAPLGTAGSHYALPNIPTGMRNEAATKALLKIADQKVNLGEDLATMGQTTRMFAQASHLLADGLMAFARDKAMRRFWNGIKPTEQNIANRYLEYVYGWKPLVQDVYALYKQATGKSLNDLILNGRGSANQQAQGGVLRYDDPSFNSTTLLGPCTEAATVRCSIWAKIDPNWAGLRALNQLGLLNPASLVWEITPWSFVVDWLLPIGSVLNALSAPAGLIFVDGSMAVRSRASTPYVHYYNVYENNPQLYKMGTNTHADGTHTYDGYRREHLTNWPLPGLWVDPDPLRGDRIFKAAALAITNLGRVRKLG
jgi:hypothetical protein